MNSDAVKSALYTSLWTFLGVFGVSLLGWISQVATWATSSSIDFPSVSPLAKAAVAALAAAASGLVALVVRTVQAKTSFPGQPPSYSTGETV